MRDVAALAGVSLKTVSRVINDEPNVRPEVAEKVRQAVRRLRYVPNAIAANLARAAQSTQSIAVVSPSMGHPFWAAVFRGVEQVAHKRGVAVFGASTEDDPSTEEALIKLFVSRQVDGLIVSPTTQDHRGIDTLVTMRRPIVYVDRSPLGVAADVVATDNQRAARIATQHLLSGGHTRVALLTDNETISTAAQRMAGYIDALDGAGLPVEPGLIRQNLHVESEAVEIILELMRRADAPTAIFASQNQSAIAAMRALQTLGLSHEVALVSMDDVVLADLVSPPLTVMAQDPEAIGQVAAERLFLRLDGEDPPPESLVVPARLIARGSGEIGPASMAR